MQQLHNDLLRLFLFRTGAKATYCFSQQKLFSKVLTEKTVKSLKRALTKIVTSKGSFCFRLSSYTPDGKKNGLQCGYHDGVLNSIDHYRDDKLDGFQFTYAEGGCINNILTFRDGSMKGYQFYYFEGEIGTIEYYQDYDSPITVQCKDPSEETVTEIIAMIEMIVKLKSKVERIYINLSTDWRRYRED
jgi:hypothetical protein